VNRLTERNNSSEQVLTFILKDVFQKKQYQVIRAFIDGLLSRSEFSKQLLKQYGNQIHYLRKYDDMRLHTAAFEGNAKIIEFLLYSVQESDHTDTVNEILLAEDEERFTAWHIAVKCNHIQVLEKLWEWAEKKLRAEEIKYNLLLAGVTGKYNCLRGKAWWGRKHKLWFSEDEFSCSQLRDPYGKASHGAGTAWHVAAEQGNFKVLQKIWEWDKEKLTTEEIRNKLLLSTDNEGRTVWHWAEERDNLDILQNVWE